MTSPASPRPRWPLAVVHDVASRRGAAALHALADALEAEEGRARARDALVDAARSERLAWGRAAAALSSAAGPGAGGFQQRARHVEWLRARSAVLEEAVRGAEAALAEARRESERRRRALASARSAVRALELHRQAWRASLADARARRDDLADDELVSARTRAAP